ncbi:sulfotransferase family protein [Xanthobacter pseudotagetidis]|uniref:sulfotransferase family protein n=1 Tax=Xanthobacter pseudotagetidis TaxID=3119911 RepID=UPI0037286CD3
MASAKRAILILGMHRSGTSLCSKIVHLMGFQAPRTLMAPTEANPEGYWESELIYKLNDRILEACGTQWHKRNCMSVDPLAVTRRTGLYEELKQLLASEFGDADRIVLKDPRISRLVPLYEAVLADAGYRATPVLVVRNPMEVAASLAKRDQFTVERAVRLWLRYTLDAERATRGRARAIISYENTLEDWREVVRKVADAMGEAADPLMAQAECRAEEAARSDLRHHELPPPAPTSWFRFLSRQAYMTTQNLLREPNDVAATRRLDRIAVAFEVF